MKKSLAIFALVIVSNLCQPTLKAASLLLDSFAEGGFSIATGGLSSNTSTFQSELVNTRTVFLTDMGISSSVLSVTEGTLTFTHSQRGLNIRNDVVSSLIYRNNNSTPFSLLGISAIGVQISNLVGEGEVLVYGSSGSDNSTSLAITGPGSLEYPISLTNGYVGGSQNTILGFKFIPRSLNFSVTLSEIILIPEPSATGLFIVGALTLLNQRRISRFHCNKF